MAMTIITSKKFDTGSITKLTGDNYRVWKIRMTSLFLSHNIMGVVDGSVRRPGSPRDPLDKWNLNNNEALTSLYMCMADQEVEAVSGCKTISSIYK